MRYFWNCQTLQSRSRIQLHYSRCRWLDIVRAAAHFAFYHKVSHQIVLYGFQKVSFAVATQVSHISVAFDDGADIPSGLPCLVGRLWNHPHVGVTHLLDILVLWRHCLALVTASAPIVYAAFDERRNGLLIGSLVGHRMVRRILDTKSFWKGKSTILKSGAASER